MSRFFPASHDEAVLALEEAGFRDADTSQTRYVLERVGIHHLRPYLDVAWCSGEPSVGAAHALWCFDRQLQAVLFEHIGVFETQLRCQYSFHMARLHGPLALYDPTLFHDATRHHASIERVRAELRRSRVGAGDPPIWEAVECATLGTLSKLYGNTADMGVIEGVAASFGVPKVKLRSWLGTVSVARNRCAHFDCFAFKRQMVSPPKRIEGVSCPNTVPLYVVLVVERMLSNDVPYPELNLHYAIELAVRVRSEIDGLLAVHPWAGQAMGLPADWRSLLFSEMVLGDGNGGDRA